MDVIFDGCKIDSINIDEIQTSFNIYDDTKLIISFVKDKDKIYVAEINASNSWRFNKICSKIDKLMEHFNTNILYLQESCYTNEGIPLTKLKIAATGNGLYSKYGFKSGRNNYNDIKNILLPIELSDQFFNHTLQGVACELLKIYRKNPNLYTKYQELTNYITDLVEYDSNCTKIRL